MDARVRRGQSVAKPHGVRTPMPRCTSPALPMVLATIALFAPAAAAAAPAPEGDPTVARFVEWAPAPGAEAAFREGYIRHLDWHRRNRDPWTWHGWFVASGDRLGTFIDGSFGHTWERLDHPVAPTEDRADNARNVYPHADVLLSVHLVRLPEHSAGDEQEALLSPLLTTLRLRDAVDAEAMWAALDRVLSGIPRQAYRVVGGPEQTWLLALPHADWAGFGRIEAAIGRWRERPGPGGADARIETLRRDPAMSYAPGS